jgi:WD40 repeat protein
MHAGISKPVRLYRFNDLCRQSRGAAYPVAELNVRTKPTSACFNPYLQHRLVVSDAEGGVMIMDTNTQHDVMQLEEHCSRVWAVDSSPHDPALLLSASADRTVRLWRANSENSVGVIAEAGQVRITTCFRVHVSGTSNRSPKLSRASAANSTVFCNHSCTAYL